MRNPEWPGLVPTSVITEPTHGADGKPYGKAKAPSGPKPEPTRQRDCPEECWDFKNGGCKRGDLCRFRHATRQARPTGDWTCPSCRYSNFKIRVTCRGCGRKAEKSLGSTDFLGLMPPWVNNVPLNSSLCFRPIRKKCLKRQKEENSVGLKKSWLPAASDPEQGRH